MDRREALKATSFLLGGTIIGADLFLTGCSAPEKRTVLVFKEEDLVLLDSVAETIIPTTPDSPGGKEAGIGAFMKVMVTDCYNEVEQKRFFEGVDDLKAKNFMKLKPDEQLSLLTGLNAQAKESAANIKAGDPPHYFTLMKQLTTLGYFSSKPGATQALRYVPIPGRFEGCIEYKGEKAWAV